MRAQAQRAPFWFDFRRRGGNHRQLSNVIKVSAPSSLGLGSAAHLSFPEPPKMSCLLKAQADTEEKPTWTRTALAQAPLPGPPGGEVPPGTALRALRDLLAARCLPAQLSLHSPAQAAPWGQRELPPAPSHPLHGAHKLTWPQPPLLLAPSRRIPWRGHRQTKSPGAAVSAGGALGEGSNLAPRWGFRDRPLHSAPPGLRSQASAFC